MPEKYDPYEQTKLPDDLMAKLRRSVDALAAQQRIMQADAVGFHVALREVAENLLQIGGRTARDESYTLSVLSQGIALALASPEWALAALAEAGCPLEAANRQIDSARQFIREHPLRRLAG